MFQPSIGEYKVERAERVAVYLVVENYKIKTYVTT
jgi:hypothetical protein